MSEVEKFKCIGYMVGRSRVGGAEYVFLSDFDRVTAERDALQQDLNQRDEQIATLESQREAWLRNSQAAERRVEVLEGLLREVVALDPRGEFLGWQLDAKIDAALKPAEGGGDDS